MSAPGCSLGFLLPSTSICSRNVGEGVVMCVRGSGKRVSVPFSDLTHTQCKEWAELSVAMKVWLTHI